MKIDEFPFHEFTLLPGVRQRFDGSCYQIARNLDLDVSVEIDYNAKIDPIRTRLSHVWINAQFDDPIVRGCRMQNHASVYRCCVCSNSFFNRRTQSDQPRATWYDVLPYDGAAFSGDI